MKTLKDHRKELDNLATTLLEKEDLEADTVMELLGLSSNGRKGEGASSSEKSASKNGGSEEDSEQEQSGSGKKSTESEKNDASADTDE